MTRIRVVDLETCGLEPPAGVVEIGAYDIADDGSESLGGASLVNPGEPIPPETSAVHHIVDEDVAQAKPFTEVVGEFIDVHAPYRADVFAAHNARFERQWITDEITGGRPWICTLRCAYRLWPEAPRHTNQTLRYWLKPDGLERDLAEPSHRALPDAYVTALLLREMVKLAEVKKLIEWSSQPALLPRVPFGKHRGEKWSDVPTDYLQWQTRQRDMDPDVLYTARKALSDRSPERAR